MTSVSNVARGLKSGLATTRIFAALSAAVLGLMLIYGAGFAQIEEVHNGAHDARHSAGFPCH
jgi:cobalt transporter subunit CbtB